MHGQPKCVTHHAVGYKILFLYIYRFSTLHLKNKYLALTRLSELCYNNIPPGTSSTDTYLSRAHRRGSVDIYNALESGAVSRFGGSRTRLSNLTDADALFKNKSVVISQVFHLFVHKLLAPSKKEKFPLG